MDLRKGYLQSTYNHFIAERDKHVLDLEVYLSNQVAIGEHSNIGDEIKNKIELIDKYDSIVSTLISRFADQMLEESEQEKTDASNN
jgi:hypothetical protein|tara:strand:- start:936 stop:1193 length:258 start_codon:yes stop_codon:yes gene_type:complete